MYEEGLGKVKELLRPLGLHLCNGNRTEWSPIRSVIIQVVTKSDDRAAGVRFVNHEYDYRQNWTTRSLMTYQSQKLQFSRKEEQPLKL